MNQLAERNAEYVMTIAELEEKCAAITAKLSMINDLMEAAEQANKLAQEATETLVQESNALAAENAGLKSALNDILQPDAAVLERNHRVRALDAMETPATDAFLAEVRAIELDSLAGVAETMLIKFSNQQCSSDMHEVVGWKMILQQAANRAAQLRKGVAQ
ncbi:hypothetical protein OGD14_004579 [Salmonella enterica]|uniref:Ead/Ea22-like family protein n=2 Tax=Salmonella enterica TaxID=28901 RepID=A0A2T6X0F9_SALET|nr:hypothetical protein [Salmonella enterica]EEM3989885.1 hypothetical protein [Salmonella enterica subsp. enterica serovar Rubislaw]EKE9787050.1 hypothetical protein [Salmonella enterica subsp. enterica]OHJ07665.1 hypothetical protein A7S37_18525 [Salmonella enterica subsp. enterica serovar Muenchen]OHM19419.1 hypothetical protein A7T19_07285 [Salmonella enterica subsp. enterica serovar Inverness]RII62328.1 hypothetical protein BUJ39_0007060 [Salmonella enterica subsp. diarizonae serovar 16:z